VDPPINDLGLAQCESGKEHINKIDFKVIFVSPMLRTCMTAVELFKEHPNKDNIKFVVYPLAKESAHLCNDFMKGPFKE
jgi:broad specificity phosphatase PhoE